MAHAPSEIMLGGKELVTMTKTSIIRLAILFSTAVFAAGCVASPSPTSPAPSATPTSATANAGAGPLQPAALGAPLYMLNCAPCHGSQGEGIDAPPLANNTYIQNANNPTLAKTVEIGFPGTEMPAWLRTNGGPFNQDQILQVIAYLRTLQPAPNAAGATSAPTASAPAPTGDPGAGKLVFGTYCAVCHGPQGVQGLPNPGSDDGSVPVLNPMDPEIVGASASEFSANLKDILQNGSIPPGDQPLIVMPAFGRAKMLTDQQMADVIAYVVQLNAAK
jgi:mono/diheme cytochrome c family protein